MQIIDDLKKMGSPKKAALSARFFKTAPGQYGHGDVFLGLTNPEQKVIANKHKDASFTELKILINHQIHECRLTALFILVGKFNRGDEKEKKIVVDFFMKNKSQVNNWDLVDSSAHQILGKWLDNRDRKILYKLAASKSLWDRRIAIVSTYHFIRNNDFADTLKISELLLKDSHDLMHKAVGWMLREVGKRDEKVLCNFLDRHVAMMPRTALRYSIERFSLEERNKYLGVKRKIN